MIKSTIHEIFNNKVDATGLSIFRMFFTVILSCEILQLYRFRHIVYDDIPFQRIGEVNVEYIFHFWFFILVLLFLGLFTRIATIVNYVFAVIIFSSAARFEYHVFYAYIGISFFLLFMPISRVFSLDSLLVKLKYTNLGFQYKTDRKVLEINYIAMVYAGIALVYFDSIFHKVYTHMWLDGLGVWLPSSLPMIAWNDTSFLLNQEYLVKFLSYLTLLFEAVFIFLFWFRKFRIPLLVLGVFFHLGILISYPIPWFALTSIALYILLVPPTFWERIAAWFKKKPNYFFYFDAECPLCNKTVVAIKHFDLFNKVQTLTVKGHASQQPALDKIPELQLLINIHGVDNNGNVYVGYDAYVKLLKEYIYTYPIGLLLTFPGISHLGKAVYKYVAGSRLTERCTAENCEMPVFEKPMSETTDFLVSGWNRLAMTKRFWKLIILFFLFAQSLYIWYSPSVQRLMPARESLNKVVDVPYNILGDFVRHYFGITHHTVFLDSHFR